MNSHFQTAIEHFKSELTSIRTGRVTPALIERVDVDAYGSPMKLIELASISVVDARTMTVDAWDKNNTKHIEKALQTHSMGFSVANDGKILRVSVPQLTEETRREIIKAVHEKLEQAKVSVRKIRDSLRETVNEQFKNKEMSEDDKFRELESIDKETKKATDELQNLATKKESELTL